MMKFQNTLYFLTICSVMSFMPGCAGMSKEEQKFYDMEKERLYRNVATGEAQLTSINLVQTAKGDQTMDGMMVYNDPKTGVQTTRRLVYDGKNTPRVEICAQYGQTPEDVRREEQVAATAAYEKAVYEGKIYPSPYFTGKSYARYGMEIQRLRRTTLKNDLLEHNVNMKVAEDKRFGSELRESDARTKMAKNNQSVQRGAIQVQGAQERLDHKIVVNHLSENSKSQSVDKQQDKAADQNAARKTDIWAGLEAKGIVLTPEQKDQYLKAILEQPVKVNARSEILDAAKKQVQNEKQ